MVVTKANSITLRQTIDHITKDLRDVADLVRNQIAAGLQESEVMDALFASWLGRLGDLPECSQGDKAEITNALTSGPWSDSQRKDLARAILLGNSDSSATKAKKRNNQKCELFENFVPEQVWVKLKDLHAYSQLSRASLLANVAHSIGIECPDQPLLYKIVAILAYCENNWEMSQDDVHRLMDKTQAFIKGHTRHSDLPYLEAYPCAAVDLPKAIASRAYPSGELHVQVDIPELNIILGDNKMRGRKR